MKRGISQEGLKLLACITMLIDHVGAALVLKASITRPELFGMYEWMRTIGRLSFPIFCFLLAEGVHYTGSPRRYALRLLLSAVLSELPFDLAFHGGIYWYSQNVMLSLFLGVCALELMKKCPNGVLKLMAAVPFALLAEFLCSDYSADGVLLMALFGITRDMPYKRLLQGLGMAFLFTQMASAPLSWASSITLQQVATLAIVPICFYSGQKKTNSKAIQWAFYLFYPAHLLALWLIGLVL